MLAVAGQDAGPAGLDGCGGAVVDVSGGVQAQAAVAVAGVVSGDAPAAARWWVNDRPFRQDRLVPGQVHPRRRDGPCPCGGSAGCACTPLQQRRYRGRLTGELGAYITIWLKAAPTVPASAVPGGQAGDADAVSAVRIAGARDRARYRYRLKDTPWRVNDDIPGAELRRSDPPSR